MEDSGRSLDQHAGKPVTKGRRMTPKVLAIALAAAVLAGCIPTLHPIYSKKDLVFEQALVGRWQLSESKDSQLSMRFSKVSQKTYRLIHTDRNGNEGLFDAHLARIDGTLFLDLCPRQPKVTDNLVYNGYLLRTHLFMVVDQLEPELRVRSFEPGWVEKHLRQHPDALAHTKVDGKIVMTASTAELQKFALRHLKTEGAYTKPGRWKRSTSRD